MSLYCICNEFVCVIVFVLVFVFACVFAFSEFAGFRDSAGNARTDGRTNNPMDRRPRSLYAPREFMGSVRTLHLLILIVKHV